jgi:carboxyl-terminal processing protease
MKHLGIIGFILISVFAPQTPNTVPIMSDSAAAYLTYALDLMQAHSINKNEINWRDLRRTTESYAAGAETTEDTYPAIVYACTQLKDHSSHLEEPLGTSKEIQERSHVITAKTMRQSLPLIKRAPSPYLNRGSFLFALLNYRGEHYAYIVIPFSASNHGEYGDDLRRHAWGEKLFHIVEEASREGAQGWILDLRGNRGGYLGPMLAGLQSFLGDGKILDFRGPSAKTEWFIENGRVLSRTRFHPTLVEGYVDETVHFDNRKSRVAILLDRSTESGAESLAIGFKGRAATLFVGEHTAGLTSSGTYWNLPDGAVLSIMSQQVSDRNGHSYPEGIEPDMRIADSTSVDRIAEDAAVSAAETWLLTPQ